MCVSDDPQGLDSLDPDERLELIRQRHQARTRGEPVEWEQHSESDGRNRTMPSPIDELNFLVRERMRPGYYGHIEVSIADGRIATVKLTETRKPGNLIPNPSRMIEENGHSR